MAVYYEQIYNCMATDIAFAHNKYVLTSQLSIPYFPKDGLLHSDMPPFAT